MDCVAIASGRVRPPTRRLREDMAGGECAVFFPLSSIEARVMYAFYDYCKKNYCCGEWGSELALLSLQFDGADVLLRPFRDDFGPRAEAWIEGETGFRVALAEKTHRFFGDYVARDAFDVEEAPCPGRNSPLKEKGNCILLEMYRLAGHPDMARSWMAPSDQPSRRAREFGRTENVSD